MPVKPMPLARCASIRTLASCCMLPTARAENSAAVNEVLKLKKVGVAEDTIVILIQGQNITV